MRKETLESWHRPFLRIASANLRSLIRLDVDLEMETVELGSATQLLSERNEQSQGLIFRMDAQSGLWLLDLSLPLAAFIIERMMGGTGKELPAADKTHELTELEQLIYQQFASSILADYARNWQPHRELKPEIVRPTRVVRSPRALGLAEEDLIARVSLRLVLNKAKIPLSILMPIAAVEELLQRLGSFEDGSRSAAYVHDPQSPLSSVPVPVSVRWQGFQITLAEVAALQPGDLLMLDNKRCELGVITLGDRARFAGKVSREPLKTVITLTHPLE
jgi:flagellar motor switch protein FliM